jgi:hypothetical protein
VSLRCEFCGTQYTSEGAAAAAGFSADETRVVPFRVEQQQAQQAFVTWLGQGLFKPGDLEATFQQRGQTGVYVPFWSFTLAAFSDWRGEDSETQHRTVTKTRTNADGSTQQYQEDEPYTVWHPRWGQHEQGYTDRVSASTGLTQEEADRLMPWDEAAGQPYSDQLLAGGKAETPGLTREEAWQRCQDRIREQERTACDGLVEKLSSVTTQFQQQGAWLSLLPVWIFTYDYKGKQYRAVVNGQTGECQGQKPIAAGKVALVAGLVVVVIAIIAAAIWYFSQGH